MIFNLLSGSGKDSGILLVNGIFEYLPRSPSVSDQVIYRFILMLLKVMVVINNVKTFSSLLLHFLLRVVYRLGSGSTW